MAEITPEVRKAYCTVQNSRDQAAEAGLANQLEVILADGLRDTLARAMKAEWEKIHRESREWDCEGCCYPDWYEGPILKDKQHNWTFTDWQKAADKELTS